jgi:hypothetical protein
MNDPVIFRHSLNAKFLIFDSFPILSMIFSVGPMHSSRYRVSKC